MAGRKPSKGRIDVDVRDSTPDWDAFLPEKAPKGRRKIVKVVFDVADDAYVDVEAHLAAAMARD